MKCKYCGKKVFKRIMNPDGKETKMRLCVNCNAINIAGWENKNAQAVKIPKVKDTKKD